MIFWTSLNQVYPETYLILLMPLTFRILSIQALFFGAMCGAIVSWLGVGHLPETKSLALGNHHVSWGKCFNKISRCINTFPIIGWAYFNIISWGNCPFAMFIQPCPMVFTCDPDVYRWCPHQALVPASQYIPVLMFFASSSERWDANWLITVSLGGCLDWGSLTKTYKKPSILGVAPFMEPPISHYIPIYSISHQPSWML